MQNPPPVQTPTKSSTGLDENVASLLSYVFGWVSGLIFFLIEKDSRLVRFHAMQSILFNVLFGILAFVIWIITFIFVMMGAAMGDSAGALFSLFSLLATLFWLVFVVAILIGWIMCLVKAFQGQYFKLPVIGNFAEKFSTK